jgi:Putative Actinobacterial Holin-X, holin superfamily III
MEQLHENFTDQEKARIPENWPTLLGRAVDDVSRVVHAELRLFEAQLAVSAEALVENASVALIVFATFIIAETCIVAAAILLLHQWLQSWWLPLGLVGTAIFAGGLALRRAPIGLNKKAAGRPTE